MKAINSIKKNVGIAAGTLATGASLTPAQASSIDFNDTMHGVIDMIFNVLTAAGVVFIVLGVVGVFRAVSNPDQGDPHALGKGLGFLVGGIVMTTIKSILTAFGIDVDSLQFGAVST